VTKDPLLLIYIAFAYGLLLFTQKEKNEIERLYSAGRRYCGLAVVLDIPRSQNVDKF
jgi:hypothetical protein